MFSGCRFGKSSVSLSRRKSKIQFVFAACGCPHSSSRGVPSRWAFPDSRPDDPFNRSHRPPSHPFAFAIHGRNAKSWPKIATRIKLNGMTSSLAVSLAIALSAATAITWAILALTRLRRRRRRNNWRNIMRRGGRSLGAIRIMMLIDRNDD
jgi:hypothetical protein